MHDKHKVITWPLQGWRLPFHVVKYCRDCKKFFNVPMGKGQDAKVKS